jgi:hypothetical protein
MDYAEVFKRDWPADAECVSACVAVYNFLSSHPGQNHYSFAQLREVSGTSENSLLARALTYLSNPNLNIVKFLYFIDAGTGMEEVEPDDEGDLRHPFTGDVLDPADLMLGFEAGRFFSEHASAS